MQFSVLLHVESWQEVTITAETKEQAEAQARKDFVLPECDIETHVLLIKED